jgi:Flp pilus assembly protein TadG
VGLSRLKTRIADFLRDSDGSATIEFLIWMPILVTIICFSADSAIYFGYKAMVMRIVEDANRAASLGRLKTAAATKTYVEGRLGDYGDDATVTVTFDTVNALIQTVVEIDTEDVTATNILLLMNVDKLYVSQERLSET